MSDTDAALRMARALVASQEESIAKAVKDFARQAADKIRRELVCCDIYEKQNGRRDMDLRGHHICFWGEASARIVETRAGLRPDESCPECGDHAGYCPRSTSLEG